MRHDFLQAARLESARLPEGYERTLLDYLRFDAVGRANAKPWDAIDGHLRTRGFVVRKEHFRQGLLKRSRESDFYIGSSDSAPHRGYFLIADLEDAQVMIHWYQARIQTELARVGALQRWIDEPVPERGARAAILHQRPEDPMPYIMNPNATETLWHQADPHPLTGIPPATGYQTATQAAQGLMGNNGIRDFAGAWRFIEEHTTTDAARQAQRERIAQYRAAMGQMGPVNPATGMSAELDQETPPF